MVLFGHPISEADGNPGMYLGALAGILHLVSDNIRLYGSKELEKTLSFAGTFHRCVVNPRIFSSQHYPYAFAGWAGCSRGVGHVQLAIFKQPFPENSCQIISLKLKSVNYKWAKLSYCAKQSTVKRQTSENILICPFYVDKSGRYLYILRICFFIAVNQYS